MAKTSKTKTSRSPHDAAEIQVVLTYSVKFDEAAVLDLDDISDNATREVILRRAAELKDEPLKRGKALTGDLKGYRSDRAAGQRYRIVFRVFEQNGEVVVVVVGIRKEGDKKDVYTMASRRVGGS